MTVNVLEVLKEIADELEVDYAMDEYLGTSDTYFVYSLERIRPSYYADDSPQAQIAVVNLYYVQSANSSYLEVIDKIFNLLIEKGFDVSPVDIDRNKKYIILSFTAELLI